MLYKRCLCIEIGNYSIKIVLYRKFGYKEEVEKYLVFRTPENSIIDGKINDIEALVKVISEKLKEGSFKVKDVNFTISGTSIITREIILPKATDKELKAILDINAGDYLPVNLSNYILDFKVLKEEVTEGAKQLKVLLVAVPRAVIERYVEISQRCGLNIQAIDFSGNSFYKTIRKEINWRSAKMGLKAGTYAVIDIGSKTTSVTIVSEGVLEFNRILLYGSENMDGAISQRYGIEEEKAEKLKIASTNILSEENDTSEQKIITDSIRSVLINMIDDVTKFFEYYSSRKTGNSIDTIFTTGSGSQLKGLEEYLQSSIGIPVYRLDKLNFIQIKKVPDADENTQYSLCSCIGAAL